MIPPGTTTQQAADDGDVITRSVADALRALTAAPTDGPPVLPHVAGTMPAPLAIARPSRADGQVRDAATAWLAARDQADADEDQEEALLHAVETSALTRRPVTGIARRIDAELAGIYLGLARYWIVRSRHTGDTRFLNAALKLCAVSVLASVPATRLAATTVAEAVDALDTLGRLGTRPPGSRGVPDIFAIRTPRVPPVPVDGNGSVRVTILAGARSSGLPLFLAAAEADGVPIAAVVLHDTSLVPTPSDSAYATAWYPKPTARTARRRVPAPQPRQIVSHRDWPTLVRALEESGPDLLVLIGMDVVPAAVLAVPRIGTVNAHNGALPAYRGMDAVAWAVLAGDPVVCTAHLATGIVDAGDILAQLPVSVDSSDLRQAVKDTQIVLLTTVCRHVRFTGRLPTQHAQDGPGRRYYRMHPALRRLLEARTTATEEATP